MSDHSFSNVTEFAPSPSKVTRFRGDYRTAVTGALRSLALIGLLATVVFCIFHYQEDLSIANLKRMVAYLDRMTLSGSETDTFTFDAGLSTACEAYDIGIATCSGGSFRFIPPFEDMSFSQQIKYANPYMRVGGDSIFVYDLGGKGISRMNSYARMAETTLESTILSFSANRDDRSVVVTDEDGYRTAVTVFDKRLQPLYKWQTSDHFAFLAALSPNGKTAAVLCIGQQGGEPHFYIRYQPVSGDECTVTVDLGDRRVYSMEYLSNDRLIVLCDNGAYAYDAEGVLKGGYAFPEGALITYDQRPESRCALTLQGDKGDTSRVVVLDGDCLPVFEETWAGNIRTMACSGDILAFLSGKDLCRVDLAENVLQKTELSGVRDVLITEAGSVAAVFGDSARLIDFTQGEE